MARRLILLLCVILALGGCKAKELVDKASIAKDLKSRGTMDLMKEVANDSYDPPADGRLTDAQIQMYLKVREKEKQIAEVAKEQLKQHAEAADKKGSKSIAGLMDGFKAIGSAADFMTADIRAAKDLGLNSQEYLWVKGQILAASTAVMAEKFNEAISANFDKAYVEAKKAYEQAGDSDTKKLYAEILSGYDKSRQEMKQQQGEQDPAIVYNRRLLSKYENALNAFAHELSKFEDKPGEVQKSFEEFQKSLEDAAK
jgi:tetratricopeptide (TPR) repeat protein